MFPPWTATLAHSLKPTVLEPPWQDISACSIFASSLLELIWLRGSQRPQCSSLIPTGSSIWYCKIPSRSQRRRALPIQQDFVPHISSGSSPVYALILGQLNKFSGTSTFNFFDPSCGVPVNKYLWLNDRHVTYPMHNFMASQIVKLLGD